MIWTNPLNKEKNPFFFTKHKIMTENQILDNQGSSHGIMLTAAGQNALRSSGTWATFLSIMGFVGIGFMVLAAIFMGAIGSFAGNDMASIYPFPMWIFSFVYLVIAVLYFFPVLFMFRFAQESKRAVLSQSSAQLELAMVNQAKMYKWSGIIVIALIVIYILVIIGAVLFGASMAGGF